MQEKTITCYTFIASSTRTGGLTGVMQIKVKLLYPTTDADKGNLALAGLTKIANPKSALDGHIVVQVPQIHIRQTRYYPCE